MNVIAIFSLVGIAVALVGCDANDEDGNRSLMSGSSAEPSGELNRKHSESESVPVSVAITNKIPPANQGPEDSSSGYVYESTGADFEFFEITNNVVVDETPMSEP